MVRYYALEQKYARFVLGALSRGEGDVVDELQQRRGSGPEVDDEIRKLVGAIHELKARFPERIRKKGADATRFEAEACVLVHRILPRDTRMLRDYDFWTWLATVKLRDVVAWRFDADGGLANDANYGIGRPEENLFYRLWRRADIAYEDGAADPYGLARVGDQDFWRSHVLRQGYASCRSLVRALIRWLYPPGGGRKRVSDPVIREVAKRLSRLRYTLFFDVLSEEEARELVEAEARRASEPKKGGTAA